MSYSPIKAMSILKTHSLYTCTGMYYIVLLLWIQLKLSELQLFFDVTLFCNEKTQQ